MDRLIQNIVYTFEFNWTRLYAFMYYFVEEDHLPHPVFYKTPEIGAKYLLNNLPYTVIEEIHNDGMCDMF